MDKGWLLIGVIGEEVPKLKSKSGIMCSLNAMGFVAMLVVLEDVTGEATVVVELDDD